MSMKNESAGLQQCETWILDVTLGVWLILLCRAGASCAQTAKQKQSEIYCMCEFV